MAYNTNNPPALLAQGIGGHLRIWAYRNTDTPAQVRVSGYVTNGWGLGMRAGDLFMYVKTDAAPITMQMFIVTSAVSGLVDLSDGLAITATDTD